MTDTVDLNFSTFKEWLLHQFTHDELVDICRHGAQNGFCGIIQQEINLWFNRQKRKAFQKHDEVSRRRRL